MESGADPSVALISSNTFLLERPTVNGILPQHCKKHLQMKERALCRRLHGDPMLHCLPVAIYGGQGRMSLPDR